MKIGTQLKIAFVAVLVVPMTIATAFSIIYYSNKIQVEALQKIASDVKVASLVYENKIKIVEEIAKYLTNKKATGAYFDMGFHKRMEKLFSKTVPQNGQYFALAVNPAGEVFGKPGKMVELNPFVKAALSGKILSGTESIEWETLEKEGIMPTYPDKPTGRILSLTASSPIRDVKGEEIVGAFIIRRILNQDLLMVNEIHQLLNVDMAIFEEHGRLISTNISDQSKIRQILSKSIQNRVFTHKQSFEEAIIKQNGYLAKYQPLLGINGNPVGVLIVKSSAAAYVKTRNTAMLYMILIASMGCIIAIFLGFTVSQRIIKGLENMTRGTKSIVNGNYTHKLKITTRDEIGELAHDFNRMSQHLYQETAERKKAEEELRQTRNYLTNVVNSMPSVLVGVDTEARVTQWNLEAEQMTGISFDNAKNLLLSDVFPEFTDEIEKVRKSLRNRQIQKESKVMKTLHNETRFSDVTVYPLLANGVEGAVIRIDDVTDKVRMEEMMIQSEKMLSVGGLAAGMAHEINNPLAGMMQTADVMLSRLTDMEMPANRSAAGEVGITMESIKSFMEKRGILRMILTINESGRRVAAIVDNMLSFARKSDAQFSSHDMVILLDMTLALAATDFDLKKHYDFKGIRIVKEYEEGLSHVPCEGTKIQQVLLNIFRNGAQVMYEKDEVERMKAEGKKPCFVLRLSKEDKTNMLRIEIEDNGPGMDEATRKRVFEPFFTTKPMGEGTGLGLSVSYFIITENHGGEMLVESQPGSGSKFIIRLPLGK